MLVVVRADREGSLTSLSRYRRVAGVRVEPLGDAWAAFSPASGETLLLNDEAAAVLEWLADGPLDDDAACRALAADAGVEPDVIRVALTGTWDCLAQAGLVRAERGAGR